MNSTITSLAQSYKAPQNVTSAIHKASAKTGIDFDYLMKQAKAESAFNPTAKAGTSSATGLYQFIESTWLNMVNTHGHKYGLSKEAAAISQNPSTGRLSVNSSSTRSAILDLRNDPKLASAMAAELAADNKSYLESKVKDGDIGATEMYFAHFLGAGGASQFLNKLHSSPHASAADAFPKAALANRNVFYEPSTGQPRSMQQVYDFFDRKFEGAGQHHTPTSHAHKPSANKGGISAHSALPFLSGQNSLTVPSHSNNAGSLHNNSGGFFGFGSEIMDQNHLYISALTALPAPTVQSSDSLFGNETNSNRNEKRDNERAQSRQYQVSHNDYKIEQASTNAPNAIGGTGLSFLTQNVENPALLSLLTQ